MAAEIAPETAEGHLWLPVRRRRPNSTPIPPLIPYGGAGELSQQAKWLEPDGEGRGGPDSSLPEPTSAR